MQLWQRRSANSEEGAEVISADGEHVGNIEQIYVDPESNYATHVLISQGLILTDKKWGADAMGSQYGRRQDVSVGQCFIN